MRWTVSFSHSISANATVTKLFCANLGELRGASRRVLRSREEKGTFYFV
jgi:hypothetical protein